MSDFDYLLKGQGVTVQNPVALAQQGLTLGQLANQQAMGSLDLQQRRQMLAAMSDPRYAAILAQMMQGSAPGGMPDASQTGFSGPTGNASGAAGGNGAGVDMQSFASDYPTAMLPLLEQQMKVRQGFATIAKDQASATKDYQDARAKGVDILGNQAARLANSDGPISPMDAEQLFAQARYVGTPASILQTMPDIADPAFKQWAGNLAAAATSPEQQANIWKIGRETPANVAKANAETALAQTNTALRPTEVGADVTRAGAAAMQAQTSRNAQNIGEVITDKNTGTSYTITPQQIGPNQWVRVATPVTQAANGAGAAQPDASPSPMASTPAEAAALAAAQAQDRAGNAVSIQVPAALAAPTQAQPGQPFQPGIGAGAEAQIAQTAKTVGDMQKTIPAAYQGLQYISQLRALDRQGIYSGGVKGTDFFKDMANVVASTPFASPDAVAKLANTQAWDSGTGELLIQMLRQMPGNRFTNQELNFLRGIKPNTLQQPNARAQIYNMLERGFQNQISYAQSAAKFTAQPGVTNLSNWSPPTAPNASAFRATAPNGISYTFPDEASMNAAMHEWDRIKK